MSPSFLVLTEAVSEGSPAGYRVSRGSIMEGFMYFALFRGMIQAKQCRVELWIEGKDESNVFQLFFIHSARISGRNSCYFKKRTKGVRFCARLHSGREET